MAKDSEILASGDWGVVIRGDCRDVMAGFAAARDPFSAVDHVITDPPYEETMHANSGTAKAVPARLRNPLEFESIEAIRPEVTPAIVQNCRGWFLAFCTAEGVAAWRDAIEAAGGRYKRAMPWVKTDATPQMNGQGPAHCLEMIVAAWCGPGHSKWNGGGRSGEFRGSKSLGRTRLPAHRPHKAEKPVWLMRKIVDLFTQPGDVVLDPFAGIGTTGVAADGLGRVVVAIERDPEYAAVAARRIADAAAQPDFFEKPKQASLI